MRYFTLIALFCSTFALAEAENPKALSTEDLVTALDVAVDSLKVEADFNSVARVQMTKTNPFFVQVTLMFKDGTKTVNCHWHKHNKDERAPHPDHDHDHEGVDGWEIDCH